VRPAAPICWHCLSSMWTLAWLGYGLRAASTCPLLTLPWSPAWPLCCKSVPCCCSFTKPILTCMWSCSLCFACAVYAAATCRGLVLAKPILSACVPVVIALLELLQLAAAFVNPKTLLIVRALPTPPPPSSTLLPLLPLLHCHYSAAQPACLCASSTSNAHVTRCHTPERKEKKKFTLSSNHNLGLLRRQPGAVTPLS